jgi:hypothetical protein
VPAAFLYMGWKTDVSAAQCRKVYKGLTCWWQGKYYMRGKLRGDTISEF